MVPSISRGKTDLACFYHRIAAKSGTGKAIVAVCRKLAVIFYNTLKHGLLYVEQGEDEYKRKREERERLLVIKLARKHNMILQV